jgi:glycosyltransferase involved in cell wall biosynthesis
VTLRILWCSDAPWSQSGYANITRQQVPALARLGHDVALLTTFGLYGAVREWEGLRVYPGGADSFANDVIGTYARDWRADIVITLKDSFVFKPEAMQGLRWCGLIPVDHEPIPPLVSQIARAMYRPIAYAPNGFRELRQAGFDPLYCPHSFDPKTFHPEDKQAARKFLGLPGDLFLIGTVAVNRGGIPSRKAWPQNLEAFKLFAADKPDARYFVHTDLAGDGFEGGVNIQALAAQLEIGHKIIFCDQARYRHGGFPDEYMRALYNALDVVNAVSVGEGFGIPQLEAQACGTPVITSDFAAARDLNFAGWTVSEGLRFYDGQGAWVFLPQPSAIAAAMEGAYKTKGKTGRGRRAGLLRRLALAGAAEYRLDHVIDRYWRPALEELEAQIGREARGRGVLRIIRPEEVGV